MNTFTEADLWLLFFAAVGLLAVWSIVEILLQARDREQAEEPTVHLCPPHGEHFTPCCGRTPFELPSTDQMTVLRGYVTCEGAGVVSTEEILTAAITFGAVLTLAVLLGVFWPVCREQVGPIAKLDGHTCRCTLSRGHRLPHRCPCGSWFEPAAGFQPGSQNVGTGGDVSASGADPIDLRTDADRAGCALVPCAPWDGTCIGECTHAFIARAAQAEPRLRWLADVVFPPEDQ